MLDLVNSGLAWALLISAGLACVSVVSWRASWGGLVCHSPTLHGWMTGPPCTWPLILQHTSLGSLTMNAYSPRAPKRHKHSPRSCFCHTFLLSCHPKQVTWPRPEPMWERIHEARRQGCVNKLGPIIATVYPRPRSRIFITVYQLRGYSLASFQAG